MSDDEDEGILEPTHIGGVELREYLRTNLRWYARTAIASGRPLSERVIAACDSADVERALADARYAHELRERGAEEQRMRVLDVLDELCVEGRRVTLDEFVERFAGEGGTAIPPGARAFAESRLRRHLDVLVERGLVEVDDGGRYRRAR